MANSYEIIRYKQKLISAVVNQDSIISLVDNDYAGVGDELMRLLTHTRDFSRELVSKNSQHI